MSATWQTHRARRAAIARHHPEDVAGAAEARRQMDAALLEDRVRRLVDEAPPLTPEQRDRLTVLLRGSVA